MLYKDLIKYGSLALTLSAAGIPASVIFGLSFLNSISFVMFLLTSAFVSSVIAFSKDGPSRSRFTKIGAAVFFVWSGSLGMLSLAELVLDL